MVDRKPLLSLTAAAFSLLALAGCGRSKDEGLTPVPAAVPAPVAAAASAPATSQSAPVQVTQAAPASPVKPKCFGMFEPKPKNEVQLESGLHFK